MTPLPHSYDIQFTGGAEAYGTASSAGLPALPMAPPTQFGGPGDAWSPEHLLLASVASCFVFTLRALARAAKVPLLNVTISAHGTVAKQGGAVRFTEIVIAPRITAAGHVDHDRLLELVDTAEDHCLISASLSTLVRIEPDFEDTSEEAVA